MKVMIVNERPIHYRVDLFNMLAKELGEKLSFCFVSNQKKPIRDCISVYHNEPFLKNARFFQSGSIMSRNIKALYYIIQNKPDIIIAGGLPLNVIFFLLYSKIYNKKVITWWSGTILSEKISLAKTLYRKLLIQQLDGAITYSTLATQYLRNLSPSFENSRTIGNNTLNVSLYQKKVHTAYVSPSSKRPTVTIITVAFLTKSKNILTLLRVFNNLSKVKSHLKLVIIGEGPELKQLQEYANHHHLSSSVVFKGFTTPDKMPAEYAAANIYVHPSLLDRWPQTFNEASAASLPIILSTTSGVCNKYTELYGKEVLFAPKDTKGLEKILSRLIDDEALRYRLGSEAYKFASQNDCQVVAERIITYLSSIL